MKLIASLIFLLSLITAAAAQVPVATGVQILRAEDARDFGPRLEALLVSPNAAIRTRAALAAGRIGDARAVPLLAKMLLTDTDADAQDMAAFALGEISSPDGSEAILSVLRDREKYGRVQARAVEAAGKIAAEVPKDSRADALKKAIFDTISFEAKRHDAADRSTVLLAITAVLRTRPDGAAKAVASFLDSPDARIRGDALNCLGRLKFKDDLDKIRSLLQHDPDAVVRANAARVLGAAADKTSVAMLLDAAEKADDLRVRVSAIRSLGALMDPKSGADLLKHGVELVKRMPAAKGSEKSELLEIATAVGTIFRSTKDTAAADFLRSAAAACLYTEPEPLIALAKVSPSAILALEPPRPAAFSNFRVASAFAQGLAAVAETKDPMLIGAAGQTLAGYSQKMVSEVAPRDQASMLKAMPDMIAALAALEPSNLDELLLALLENPDPFVRAAAAQAIADRPPSKESAAALEAAFTKALLTDKHENDAQLAILDALAKVDKKAVGTFSLALSARDYLVRKKAFDILDDKDLQKEFPGVPVLIEAARKRGAANVQPYSPAFGTKLGQLLNTDVDYRRALSRQNGTVKAILTTRKGAFTIEFTPEEAPLTVDNFIKLARVGYFNGVDVHRVVPNFVMQDGDPRGDGNGGPGYSIRCEINMLSYDRGAVGMALSGKDTGGSQWFVTHSPQPHLDGGYTVFGHVSERDMPVVDRLVRGDKIISVRIVGR